MEVVIFVGIQASGKTTFYHERFANTHARVSLDVIRNRDREQAQVKRHLAEREPFVVDNTNVTKADRARYITAGRAAGFRVIGDYFPTDPRKAVQRNRKRPGKEN